MGIIDEFDPTIRDESEQSFYGTRPGFDSADILDVPYQGVKSLASPALSVLELGATALDTLGRPVRTLLGTGDLGRSFESIYNPDKAVSATDLRKQYLFNDVGTEGDGFFRSWNPRDWDWGDVLDTAADVTIGTATDPLSALSLGTTQAGKQLARKSTAAMAGRLAKEGEIIAEAGQRAIGQGLRGAEREAFINRARTEAKDAIASDYLKQTGKELPQAFDPNFTGLQPTLWGRLKAGEEGLQVGIPFTSMQKDIKVPSIVAATVNPVETVLRQSTDLAKLTPIGKAVADKIDYWKQWVTNPYKENATGLSLRDAENRMNELRINYMDRADKINQTLVDANLSQDERVLVRDLAEMTRPEKGRAGEFLPNELVPEKDTNEILGRIGTLPTQKQAAIYAATRESSALLDDLYNSMRESGVDISRLGSHTDEQLRKLEEEHNAFVKKNSDRYNPDGTPKADDVSASTTKVSTDTKRGVGVYKDMQEAQPKPIITPVDKTGEIYSQRSPGLLPKTEFDLKRVSTHNAIRDAAKAEGWSDDATTGVLSVLDGMSKGYSNIYKADRNAFYDKIGGVLYSGAQNVDPVTGAVRYGALDMGNKVINLFKGSKPDTAIHESAHLLRDLLEAQDQDVVKGWLRQSYSIEVPMWRSQMLANNVTNESLLKTAEKADELFAQGFEKYIKTGYAPTKRMAGIFDKLKQWMRDILNSVTGIRSKDVDLNQDMIDLFQRYLGKQPETADTIAAKAFSSKPAKSYGLAAGMVDATGKPKAYPIRADEEKAVEKQLKKHSDTHELLSKQPDANGLLWMVPKGNRGEFVVEGNQSGKWYDKSLDDEKSWFKKYGNPPKGPYPSEAEGFTPPREPSPAQKVALPDNPERVPVTSAVEETPAATVTAPAQADLSKADPALVERMNSAKEYLADVKEQLNTYTDPHQIAVLKKDLSRAEAAVDKWQKRVNKSIKPEVETRGKKATNNRGSADVYSLDASSGEGTFHDIVEKKPDDVALVSRVPTKEDIEALEIKLDDVRRNPKAQVEEIKAVRDQLNSVKEAYRAKQSLPEDMLYQSEPPLQLTGEGPKGALGYNDPVWKEWESYQLERDRLLDIKKRMPSYFPSRLDNEYRAAAREAALAKGEYGTGNANVSAQRGVHTSGPKAGLPLTGKESEERILQGGTGTAATGFKAPEKALTIADLAKAGFKPDKAKVLARELGKAKASDPYELLHGYISNATKVMHDAKIENNFAQMFNAIPTSVWDKTVGMAQAGDDLAEIERFFKRETGVDLAAVRPEIRTGNLKDVLKDGSGPEGWVAIDGLKIGPGLQTKAFMPIEAAKTYNNLKSMRTSTEHYSNIIRNLMGSYMPGLAVWKKLQTMYWPKFHIRNQIGDFVRMAQEDATDLETASDMRKLWSRSYDMAKRTSTNDFSPMKGVMFNLGDAGRAHFGSPNGMVDGEEFFRFLAKEGHVKTGASADALREGLNREVNKDSVMGKLASSGDMISSFAFLRDDFNKAAAVAARMRSGDSALEASLRAEKALFNYNHVSPAADFLRKTGIAPFVSWSALNIPAQFEWVMRHPGAFAAVVRAHEMMGSNELPEEDLPKYLRDQYNIVTSKTKNPDTGKVEYNIVTTSGLLPMSDLVDLGTSFKRDYGTEWAKTQLGPIAKLGLELFGSDEDELEKKNWLDRAGSTLIGKPYKAVDDFLGKAGKINPATGKPEKNWMELGEGLFNPANTRPIEIVSTAERANKKAENDMKRAQSALKRTTQEYNRMQFVMPDADLSQYQGKIQELQLEANRKQRDYERLAARNQKVIETAKAMEMAP